MNKSYSVVSLDTSLAVDTSDPPPHRGVLHPYDDPYYRWKESTKGATTLLRHTYLYTRRYNYDELHMQRPLQQEFDSNRKNVTATAEVRSKVTVTY